MDTYICHRWVLEVPYLNKKFFLRDKTNISKRLWYFAGMSCNTVIGWMQKLAIEVASIIISAIPAIFCSIINHDMLTKTATEELHKIAQKDYHYLMSIKIIPLFIVGNTNTYALLLNFIGTDFRQPCARLFLRVKLRRFQESSRNSHQNLEKWLFLRTFRGIKFFCFDWFSALCCTELSSTVQHSAVQ